MHVSHWTKAAIRKEAAHILLSGRYLKVEDRPIDLGLFLCFIRGFRVDQGSLG